MSNPSAENLPASVPEAASAPQVAEIAPVASLAEEVDVWWGAYSGWTMLPSFVVCLLLTGLIAWACRWFVPRNLGQIIFLVLAGLLWAGQLLRWAYRVLSCNYRLTTHRLFLERGFRLLPADRISLTKVVHVSVRRSSLDRVVRVGHIRIQVEDRTLPVVLAGIRHPAYVAERVRDRVQKARQRAAATPGS